MKNEKETKQKLLDSAKKEFLEKGFLQASLRNICKEAGVTTGALYFFYRDKEDLFSNIVDGPLQSILNVTLQHFESEQKNGAAGVYSNANGAKTDFSDDMEAAEQVIHYLFQYHDEFQLLLLQSQGTKYENILDIFIDISEKHYRKLIDVIADQKGIPRKDEQLIHWISHMTIDIFVFILKHDQNEEEAKKHMADIMQYLMFGFNGMFQ